MRFQRLSFSNTDNVTEAIRAVLEHPTPCNVVISHDPAVGHAMDRALYRVLREETQFLR